MLSTMRKAGCNPFADSQSSLDTKVTSALDHLRLSYKYYNESNYEQALPHSMKAFELLKTQFGENSIEITQALHEVIIQLTGLGRHREALEKNALLQKIYNNLGMPLGVLTARIHAVDFLIDWGKLDDALEVSMKLVKDTCEVSAGRANVHFQIARVLYLQGKVLAAKGRLKMASDILGELVLVESDEENDAMYATRIYQLMGRFYEEINEMKLATKMCSAALDIVEKLPRGLFKHNRWMVVLPTVVGQLLLKFKGNEELAVTYLKRGVEVIKEVIDEGAKFLENDLGATYSSLGDAYLKTDKAKAAAVALSKARDIIVAKLGPMHKNTIHVYWNLAEAYSKTRRIFDSLVNTSLLLFWSTPSFLCGEQYRLRQSLIRIDRRSTIDTDSRRGAISGESNEHEHKGRSKDASSYSTTIIVTAPKALTKDAIHRVKDEAWLTPDPSGEEAPAQTD
ncbi:hypothetical protein GIB67_022629 [Kingdonia uniflora]|uniref:Uncharacterized protein n=1 Tax=Kingdonia uniflora TaxID=39325 RepID=A0A7J7P869_9MAGN|nr:hypothetical protein GIB67_022629 [Kingdonia uniflora]